MVGLLVEMVIWRLWSQSETEDQAKNIDVTRRKYDASTLLNVVYTKPEDKFETQFIASMGT
jgi:hypothetical protein